MKMILKLLMLSSVLVLFSCQKDSETDYNKKNLVGDWYSVKIEGKDVEKREFYYMGITADMRQSYGSSFDVGKGYEWKESYDYTYTVNEDVVQVRGKNPQGLETLMIMRIIELNKEMLKYECTCLEIGGEEIRSQVGLIYEMKNAGVNKNIVGKWEGKEDGTNNSNSQWEYHTDGSFDYYYQEDGEFVKKEDNNGSYFVHGELMVSNYTNDHETSVAGRAAEAWIVSVSGNTMKWKGISATLGRSFTMTKK